LRLFASQRLTRRQSRLNRRANVATITANIAGQWRLTLRFRLRMQTRLNPPHLATSNQSVSKNVFCSPWSIGKSSIIAYEKARQLSNDPISAAYFAQPYGLAGRHDDALRIKRELNELAAKRYVPKFAFALIALGLNNKAKGLDLLEQAVRNEC
jgi:hypothetical protein